MGAARGRPAERHGPTFRFGTAADHPAVPKRAARAVPAMSPVSNGVFGAGLAITPEEDYRLLEPPLLGVGRACHEARDASGARGSQDRPGDGSGRFTNSPFYDVPTRS